MVPDKFNMVDMGGIDLIMMQGEEVPGLYMRLVESIAQCRYQCLYNWLFDGVIIPPSYVKMEVNEDDEVAINEGVAVSSDDVIHIHSLEIPIYPVIQELNVADNGVYTPPEGVDGFSPVNVLIPDPPLQAKETTTNGIIVPDSDYYGLSSVSVNVADSAPIRIVDKNELTAMKASTKPGQSTTSVGPSYFMPYRALCCFQSDSVELIYGATGSYIRVGRGNNKVIQFLPKIPARCQKLYLEIAADAAGQSYPISTLNLVSALGLTGYYSGNWSGQTLKSYILTNNTDPGEQEGLTLTRTSAYVVPRQVAEIDLSSINVDCYFTFFACRSYFYIYDIYAE